MAIDGKSLRGSTSKGDQFHSQPDVVASTSERKLSVELPAPKHIYTIGSTVSGLVRLGTKDRDAIQEVKVSLVCVVRSMFHRYYGGSARDIRRETNNLLHEDQTLWSRADGDTRNPPAEFSFQVAIPEFGNDVRGKDYNAPLPPSFYAGRHRGWKSAVMLTYGTPIGFIKYHIKVSVVRKGSFRRKERSFCPFVFLPPSAPPPLFPTPPEIFSVQDLGSLGDLWHCNNANANVHRGIFSSCGQGTLTLCMPNVPSFSRLMRIPFILSLVLQTQPVRNASENVPPSNVMPPPAQLDRASLHVRRNIQSRARRAVQHHIQLFDQDITDNLLHGITPQEGTWTLKKADGESYWEKDYIWRGLWTFRDVPNFANRQLTWKYALVAEVPIKGVGNAVKLVSQDLEMSSAIAGGTNVIPTSEEDLVDLPPDYFDIEGLNDDEGDENNESSFTHTEKD